MDAARIKRLGGVGLVLLSVGVAVVALVLFGAGKAGTPPGPEQVAGYAPARITVYAPADADMAVQLTFRPADAEESSESVSVTRQGAATNTRPVLALVELEGAARLVTHDPAGPFHFAVPVVDLPAIANPIFPGRDSVGARQMYLVQFPAGVDLFGPRIAGDAEVAAVQTETSRTTFSSGEVLLKKCRGLPGSIDELRTPTGFDTARLGRLADLYGRTGRCTPDEADYRGADLGRVEVRDANAASGSVRLDYTMPETRKEAAVDYAPTVDWSWTPHWSPAGAFAAQANYVDINREAAGQSYLFVSGALIGVASSTLPAGIGLLAGPWLARRGRTGPGDAGDEEVEPPPPAPAPPPSRRRFNSR